MTEPCIVKLMHDSAMQSYLRKVARRYAGDPDDQEEYVQDAMLRIARECEDDDKPQEMMREGKLAIQAVYRRRKRYVDKKMGQNVNRSIGEAVLLPRGRRIPRKPIRLDSWFYVGEWINYGLDRNGCVVRDWYTILLDESGR